VIGSPLRYMALRVCSVTFFRDVVGGVPKGECDEYRICALRTAVDGRVHGVEATSGDDDEAGSSCARDDSKRDLVETSVFVTARDIVNRYSGATMWSKAKKILLCCVTRA
jgi:hypothetical protein